MPIKKPSSKFGLQEVLWLTFVFCFLIMVFVSTGCKSVQTVPDTKMDVMERERGHLERTL